MNDSVKIFRIASIWCLSFSIVTLAYTEIGFTSWMDTWNPSHETSIALGVISIAFRIIAIDLDKKFASRSDSE